MVSFKIEYICPPDISVGSSADSEFKRTSKEKRTPAQESSCKDRRVQGEMNSKEKTSTTNQTRHPLEGDENTVTDLSGPIASTLLEQQNQEQSFATPNPLPELSLQTAERSRIPSILSTSTSTSRSRNGEFTPDWTTRSGQNTNHHRKSASYSLGSSLSESDMNGSLSPPNGHFKEHSENTTLHRESALGGPSSIKTMPSHLHLGSPKLQWVDEPGRSRHDHSGGLSALSQSRDFESSIPKPEGYSSLARATDSNG